MSSASKIFSGLEEPLDLTSLESTVVVDSLVQRYLLSFGDSKIVSHGLYGFTVVNKLSKRGGIVHNEISRLHLLTDDVVALPFSPVMYSMAEYPQHVEEFHLRGYDFREAVGRPEFDRALKHIKERARKETIPGGALSLGARVLVARVTAGSDASARCPPMRLLRGYLDYHGPETPFILASGGEFVDKIAFDSVTAIRVNIFLNATHAYFMYDGMDDRWWTEVIGWLAADPWKRTKMLAAWRSEFLTAIGAAAEAGAHLHPFPTRMEADGEILFNTAYNKASDAVYYSSRLKQITAMNEEMIKEGLMLHAAQWRRILTDGPSRDTFKRVKVLWHMEFLAGFSRGQDHITQFEQLTIGHGPEYVEGKTLWETELLVEYTKAMEYMLPRLPNERAFRAMVPGSLKSTSAGGASVSFDVPLTGARRPLGTKARGSTAKVRLTDKAGIFMTDPESFLDARRLQGLYTRDNPGRIGVRNVVGGKGGRAISNIKVEEYVQSLIYSPMNAYVNQHPNVLAGSTTGSNHIDMTPLMYATGDPNLVIAAADYKFYDGTQASGNVLKHTGAVMVAAARKVKLDYAPYLNAPGGVAGLIALLNSEGVKFGGHFTLGRPNPEVTKMIEDGATLDSVNAYCKENWLPFRILALDVLRSGELVTLAFNSLNNIANYNCWLDYYPLKEALVYWFSVQGDDSLMILEMNQGVFTRAWSDDFANTFSKISNVNGLLINPDKVSLRINAGEYVKIMYYLCCEISRPSLLFENSEKPMVDLPIPMMRSMLGKFATMVARGADHSYVTRLAHFFWAFRRSYLGSVSYTERHSYFLPFSALYVPKSDGGVGMVPHTVMMQSADVVIVEEIRHRTEAEIKMFMAAKRMLRVQPQGRERVIDTMMRGWYEGGSEPSVARSSADQEFITPFQRGVDYIRGSQPHQRVMASKQAVAELDSIGFNFSNMAYERMPENMVRTIVSSTGSLRNEDRHQKTNALKVMSRLAARSFAQNPDVNYSPGELYGEHGWMAGVTFTILDELEDKLDPVVHPWIEREPLLEAMIRKLGYGNRDRYAIRKAAILNRLRADPHFQRSLSDDAIIDKLADPKIIGSPSRIWKFLIGIGAEPTAALAVANMFVSRASSFLFRTSVSEQSTNTPGIRDVDLSLHNHTQVVDFLTTGHKDVDDVLLIQGFLACLAYGLKTGRYHRIGINYPTDIVQRLMSSMLGGVSGFNVDNLLELPTLYGFSDKYGEPLKM
jgi:hypothetical protein